MSAAVIITGTDSDSDGSEGKVLASQEEHKR